MTDEAVIADSVSSVAAAIMRGRSRGLDVEVISTGHASSMADPMSGVLLSTVWAVELATTQPGTRTVQPLRRDGSGIPAARTMIRYYPRPGRPRANGI